MTSQQLVQNFIPRNYDLFVGLDVDKTSISVTFRDHGDMLRSMRMPYSAECLLNYTRKHFPGRKIAFAYEVGPTGFGLHDELTAEGHPCLVVAPSMVPTAPGQRVKTNRLDSKTTSEADSCKAFMFLASPIASCDTWSSSATPLCDSWRPLNVGSKPCCCMKGFPFRQPQREVSGPLKLSDN